MFFRTSGSFNAQQAEKPPWCFQADLSGKLGSHWIVEKVVCVWLD
jgi:hypothetical protein